MLAEFVNHVAQATRTDTAKALDAIGIVLNAADRQGAPMASLIFERIAGARTLAACMGAETGAATGVIARLIEQTPAGQSAVAEKMLLSLLKTGLGHAQIGALLPAIGEFAETRLGLDGLGHMGDVLGQAPAVADVRDARAG